MKRLVGMGCLLLSAGAAFAGTIGDVADIPPVKVQKDKDLKGFLGIAGLQRPEYVGGNDTETVLAPLISLDYKDTAYIKLNRAGVWFWKPEDTGLRFGALLKSRRGWRRNDGDRLANMDTRGDSIEAGLNVAWEYQRFQAEAGYLTDISSTSDGDSAFVNLRYALVRSPKWQLMGQVGFEYLDDDTADYYFGVQPSEAAPGRPAYSPSDAWNTSAGLVATYIINESWLVMGGAVYTKLGDELKDSPIVEDDSYTTLFGGVAWRF